MMRHSYRRGLCAAWALAAACAHAASPTEDFSAEQLETLETAARLVLTAETQDQLLKARAMLVNPVAVDPDSYWQRAAEILVDHRMKELEQQEKQKQASAVPVTDILELRRLMDRFAATYQLGRIDEFMLLFDREAKANNQYGSTVIRQAYEKLFSETKQRHMVIKNVQWEREPGVARGHGDFEVEVVHRGKLQPKSYTGRISFDIKDSDQQLTISSLSYSACELEGF